MYKINIKKGDEPIEIIRHELCAEDITDIEMMLTAIISKQLGINNLVLMPMGNHTFKAYRVIDLHAQVSIVPIEEMS